MNTSAEYSAVIRHTCWAIVFGCVLLYAVWCFWKNRKTVKKGAAILTIVLCIVACVKKVCFAQLSWNHGAGVLNGNSYMEISHPLVYIFDVVTILLIAVVLIIQLCSRQGKTGAGSVS